MEKENLNIYEYLREKERKKLQPHINNLEKIISNIKVSDLICNNPYCTNISVKLFEINDKKSRHINNIFQFIPQKEVYEQFSNAKIFKDFPPIKEIRTHIDSRFLDIEFEQQKVEKSKDILLMPTSLLFLLNLYMFMNS
jgi:hypothetical protein